MADSGSGKAANSSYLAPLAAVKDFFECLTDLKGVSRAPSQHQADKMLEACDRLTDQGERVARCLHHQMQRQNRANEVTQEISGAFQIGVKKLVHLKSEVADLKKVINELNLAERGLDSTNIGPIPSSAASTYSDGSSFTFEEKHQTFSIPGAAPIPRASSYEDFRKHRDLTLSSAKKAESSAGGSSIRKAKSESDVHIVSLKKKVESLTIDNGRLKEKEKKLVKESIKLNRNVRALVKERDMAEDRLKIEQTQRDSIEKLRQRNKELEEQLRKLCESQILREREATQSTDSPLPGKNGVNKPPEEASAAAQEMPA